MPSFTWPLLPPTWPVPSSRDQCPPPPSTSHWLRYSRAEVGEVWEVLQRPLGLLGTVSKIPWRQWSEIFFTSPLTPSPPLRSEIPSYFWLHSMMVNRSMKPFFFWKSEIVTMKSPTLSPLVKNILLHWLQGIFETVPYFGDSAAEHKGKGLPQHGRGTLLIFGDPHANSLHAVAHLLGPARACLQSRRRSIPKEK